MPGIEIGGEPIEVDPDLTTGLDPQYLGDPIDQRRAQACATEPRRAQACTEFPRRLNACGEAPNVGWAVWAQIVFNFDAIIRAAARDCSGAYDETHGPSGPYSYPSYDEINQGTTPGRWFLADFTNYYTDYSANPNAAPPLSWRNHPQRVVRARHFISCLEGVSTIGGWDGVGNKFFQCLPRWGSRSVTVGATTYNFPSAFTMAFFLDEVKWPQSAYNVSDTSYDYEVAGDCCRTFHSGEEPPCYQDNEVTVTEWSYWTNYTGISAYRAGDEICAYATAPPDLGECVSWDESFPTLWWYSAGTSHGEVAEAGRGAIEVIFGYLTAQAAFAINALPQPDYVIVRIQVDASRVMNGEISPATPGYWTMTLVDFVNPIEEVLSTLEGDSVAGEYYHWRKLYDGYDKRVGFTATAECPPSSGISACFNIGGDHDDTTGPFTLCELVLFTAAASDSCQ